MRWMNMLEAVFIAVFVVMCVTFGFAFAIKKNPVLFGIVAVMAGFLAITSYNIEMSNLSTVHLNSTVVGNVTYTVSTEEPIVNRDYGMAALSLGMFVLNLVYLFGSIYEVIQDRQNH